MAGSTVQRNRNCFAEDGGRCPKLIVLDLDQTLWPFDAAHPRYARPHVSTGKCSVQCRGGIANAFIEAVAVVHGLGGEKAKHECWGEHTTGDAEEEHDVPQAQELKKRLGPEDRVRPLEGLYFEALTPSIVAGAVTETETSRHIPFPLRVAVASANSQRDTCCSLLRHLGLLNVPRSGAAQHCAVIDPSLLEIHPGSKREHLTNLARASGVDFADMLFFDDNRNNVAVARRLGVVVQEVSPLEGLTFEAFRKGIVAWRAQLRSKSAMTTWLKTGRLLGGATASSVPAQGTYQDSASLLRKRKSTAIDGSEILFAARCVEDGSNIRGVVACDASKFNPAFCINHLNESKVESAFGSNVATLCDCPVCNRVVVIEDEDDVCTNGNIS
eukprot:TRINITY_DN51736_c0_g1_i1.p1 TRINITY_DN51736_c0_g1~~TRINITY_DN51736_c0_g1_i1.p1  ORF type:complete len:406 (-),score=62.18 TRINITY_DN51736_c0_g1_i1:26-1180(-)